MKLNLLLSGLLLLATGCHKVLEQVEENIVIRAMTEGQWRITSFTRAGADHTADYAPYRFQFYKNNTVEAINNGITETTGSWSADANARTITATYNTVTPPLNVLNGTWQITNNSWTFVEATQTVSGEIRTLRLEK